MTTGVWPVEIVFGTLTLWLLVELIKAISDRDRPFHTLDKARVIGWRERGNSFPSGHTTQVFFLTALLIYHFQFGMVVAGALYAVAALVGLTRIYVGAHYPRDVIAGVVLGSVWGLLATPGGQPLVCASLVMPPPPSGGGKHSPADGCGREPLL